MKLYIESSNGHDTIDVPKGEEQKAIEEQLKDGKWVTTEKSNGDTEILTESDIPEEEEEDDEELDEEDKALQGDWKGTFNKAAAKPAAKPTTIKPATPTVKREEWKSKFDDVTSATSTHKAKGG